MILHRLYTCATREQAEARLAALLSTFPGGKGSYRQVLADEVEDVIQLDERFQDQGHNQQVARVLRQMIQMGLAVYLFEIR